MDEDGPACWKENGWKRKVRTIPMRKEKKRRRAGKAARWRGIKGSVMIFAVFCLVTVISTILYEVLPLPKIPFLWGEDAFYQTIVMGMYNSLLDFAVFSILLTVLLKRQERADTVQRYLDDLDACRFWFSTCLTKVGEGNV